MANKKIKTRLFKTRILLDTMYGNIDAIISRLKKIQESNRALGYRETYLEKDHMTNGAVWLRTRGFK